LGCVIIELAVCVAGREYGGLEIHKWHEHREVEIDRVTANAYHASLEKVVQWFRVCTDDFVRNIYFSIIGRMMCTSLEDRLEIVKVSRLMIKLLQVDVDDVVNPCSRCCLDLWLDTPADTLPEHPVVINTENTPEHKSCHSHRTKDTTKKIQSSIKSQAVRYWNATTVISWPLKTFCEELLTLDNF
jgi:hypothetical protein